MAVPEGNKVGLPPQLLEASKKWGWLASAVQSSPSQDPVLGVLRNVLSTGDPVAQNEFAGAMINLLGDVLPAHLLALARTPKGLLAQTPLVHARLLDYLNLYGRACASLLTSSDPYPRLWAIYAPLLRLAWNILRSSPAKRAETSEAVINWARDFLGSHLHPHGSEDVEKEVASAISAAMAAELEKMINKMQPVLDCLTPVEDSPPSPWPRPPKSRPPETLPNIVSFSQALIEYWRIGQLMGALKGRPCVTVQRHAVAQNALKLLQVVQGLVTHASRYIDLVHALASMPPSNRLILPVCLHDVKPLLRLTGTCYGIIRDCWACTHTELKEQSSEELDRLGVLEVTSVAAGVRGRCDLGMNTGTRCDSGVQPFRLAVREDVSRRPRVSQGDATASGSSSSSSAAQVLQKGRPVHVQGQGESSQSSTQSRNGSSVQLRNEGGHAQPRNDGSDAQSRNGGGSQSGGGGGGGGAASSGSHSHGHGSNEDSGPRSSAASSAPSSPAAAGGGTQRPGRAGGRSGFCGSNSRGRGRGVVGGGSHAALATEAAGGRNTAATSTTQCSSTAATAQGGGHSSSGGAAGQLAAAAAAARAAEARAACAAAAGKQGQQQVGMSTEGLGNGHQREDGLTGCRSTDGVDTSGSSAAHAEGKGSAAGDRENRDADGEGGGGGSGSGMNAGVGRKGSGELEVGAPGGQPSISGSHGDSGLGLSKGRELQTLLDMIETMFKLSLFSHQIQAGDLIGRFPVLPLCLSLRSRLPLSVRAAVVQTLMPEKRQGCLDHHATITLKVDRANLLATSLHQLQRHEPHMLAQRPIALKFKGEEGTGSGVTRDWLTQLSKELVDPNYGIVVHLGPDLRTIHPSPAGQVVHGDDLPKIMQTAGMVLGLAITMRVPLGVQLSSAALDLALGRSMTLGHLEELDKELAASCRALLQAEPESVEGMGLTFVASNHSLMGETSSKPEVALVPGGEGKAVTAENRGEYVQLLSAFCCNRGSTRVAATELVKGMLSVSPCFHQRFHKNPVEMLAGVSAADLALLIRGSEASGSQSEGAPALSVSEWRTATAGHGFGEGGEEYIDTFFDVVEHELTAEEQKSLLLFWTGLANLPLGGFSSLPSKPQLWCANEGAGKGASGEQLPQAHTCFMQLTLPRYQTRKDLVTALRTALKHAEKFDMA